MEKPVLGHINRANQLGDGLFETMFVVEGRIINDVYHYKRLMMGAQILKLDLGQIEDAWNVTVQKLEDANGRARLTLWRRTGRGYLGDSKDFDFNIEVTFSSRRRFVVEKEFSAGFYDGNRKYSENDLNGVKSISSALYIQATNAAQENGLDESILLNEKGEVVEFGSSNLFLKKGNIWYTPILSSGCLPGTMRVFILEHQDDLNVEIKEGHLYPSDFEEATAVMLSNAIKGLQPVTRVGDLLFSCKEEVRALVNKLNSVMGLQET